MSFADLKAWFAQTLSASALASTSASPSSDGPPLSPEFALAVLLFEVAWADHDISDAEQQTIVTAASEMTGRSAGSLRDTLSAAREQVQDHVGVQGYTRLLVERWSYSDRCRLIEALWRVALAEDGIDPLEEARVRHCAELLYVAHADFIAAKQAARRR